MFIVIEIQTNADSTVGVLVNSYENQNQAESAYHGVLEAAAISSLPKHACVMLTEEGFRVKNECYNHTAQPTAEE